MLEDATLWAIFGGVVLVLIAFDLFVNRKAHIIRLREAVLWSLFWIGVSLLFNLFLFFWLGSDKALEFFTGYLIEKSLSVDNLFVFLLIFSYFEVPREYQHRTLYAGVLGAIILRGVFISVGIALIGLFAWFTYIFGVVVIYSAVRIALERAEHIHPDRNPILRFARRYFNVSQDFHGQQFFFVSDGLLLATPLFIVLLAIETTDIAFSVDSIPAVFAITRDTFIVFSSNIFAILGLRALYFALSDLRERFLLLRYGLAGILLFVGAKMLLRELVNIPLTVTLGVVASILLVSAIASIIMPPKPRSLPSAASDQPPPSP